MDWNEWDRSFGKDRQVRWSCRNGKDVSTVGQGKQYVKIIS